MRTWAEKRHQTILRFGKLVGVLEGLEEKVFEYLRFAEHQSKVNSFICIGDDKGQWCVIHLGPEEDARRLGLKLSVHQEMSMFKDDVIVHFAFTPN